MFSSRTNKPTILTKDWIIASEGNIISTQSQNGWKLRTVQLWKGVGTADGIHVISGNPEGILPVPLPLGSLCTSFLHAQASGNSTFLEQMELVGSSVSMELDDLK